jgi:hypothetical protein
MNLALRSIFVHTSKDSLICLKILHEVDSFTYSPKEGVLRIFIALKSPSSSAAFEPAHLGSSDKHANHYHRGRHVRSMLRAGSRVPAFEMSE